MVFEVVSMSEDVPQRFSQDNYQKLFKEQGCDHECPCRARHVGNQPADFSGPQPGLEPVNGIKREPKDEHVYIR